MWYTSEIPLIVREFLRLPYFNTFWAWLNVNPRSTFHKSPGLDCIILAKYSELVLIIEEIKLDKNKILNISKLFSLRDNIKFINIFIRLRKQIVKTKIIKISFIIKFGKAVLKNNAMDKIEKDLRKSSIKHLE